MVCDRPCVGGGSGVFGREESQVQRCNMMQERYLERVTNASSNRILEGDLLTLAAAVPMACHASRSQGGKCNSPSMKNQLVGNKFVEFHRAADT